MSHTTTSTADTIRAATPWLTSWIAQQAAFRRATGVQVAIRSGDEVVLDTAWGVADVTTGEPLRTDHLFRIASHSKTFTATAVLQLVEQGRLRLDDTVAGYIPELAEHPIGTRTVRELLGHQAGVIRDGDVADFWQLDGPFPDRAALLDDVLANGEVFAANQHFKYSNVGYSLLGLVIEAVAGTGYVEHLRSAVVEPLGLTRTGAEYDPARAEEYAAGHTALLDADDRRERIEHVDTAAMAAATGFFSTAREMTSYGAAHFFGDERLLSDASKRIIQRQESVVSAYGTELGRYGVGMDLHTFGERDVVGHSGGYPGHITRTYIDPTDKLVVSVLTNAIDGPADAIAVGLIKLIDLALNPPQDSAPAQSPERFTGRFANLWGISDIVELGGRLVLIRPTAVDALGGFEELSVIDDDHLRIHAGPGFGTVGEVLTIDRKDDGSIRSIRSAMTQWPLADFRARRTAMTHHRPAGTEL